jgi:hypothetical protein
VRHALRPVAWGVGAYRRPVRPTPAGAVAFTTDDPRDEPAEEAETAEDAPSPEANVVELRRGRRPRPPSA